MKGGSWQLNTEERPKSATKRKKNGGHVHADLENSTSAGVGEVAFEKSVRAQERNQEQNNAR
jgi:hypothetical protein